jgi:hypothetical protein
MPGYSPQRRGTARTLPNFCVVLFIVCFVSFCVLFVCICVLYYCHWVATQLQLTNMSYHDLCFFPNIIYTYVCVCVCNTCGPAKQPIIPYFISLFCHRGFCYHTFLKNHLMQFIFKITLLKHKHSSKTFECLCPCVTLHVSVINLDHPQGYCSCCNATVHLVLFVTTLSGHVAVFSVVLLSCVPSCYSSCCILPTTRTETQPHAQIKL